MPTGNPMKGNISPSAAAALGARVDSAFGRAAGNRCGSAPPGAGAGRGKGSAPDAPAGAAFRGRPHCQQAADAGKLFAPQYRQRTRPASPPGSLLEGEAAIYFRFGSVIDLGPSEETPCPLRVGCMVVLPRF